MRNPFSRFRAARRIQRSNYFASISTWWCRATWLWWRSNIRRSCPPPKGFCRRWTFQRTVSCTRLGWTGCRTGRISSSATSTACCQIARQWVLFLHFRARETIFPVSNSTVIFTETPLSLPAALLLSLLSELARILVSISTLPSVGQ